MASLGPATGQNANGLTFREWLAAAGIRTRWDSVNRKPIDVHTPHDFLVWKHAWATGEDPTDYKANA